MIPDAAITCSSDLGRIGLLERENAGLLNAALADLARDTIAAFEKAIARFRHRRAAVHHPERRHGGGGAPGAAPAGLFLRLGRHQFDARRGLSLGPGRRHGDRCRRHHHRCRPAQARLSARGQLGGQGGRRAHAVPHARSAVDRAGRRQPRRARSAEGRAGVGRLSPAEGRHRLRRQAAHHDGHRRRRRACWSSATGRRSRISTRRPARRCSPRPPAWPRRRSTA